MGSVVVEHLGGSKEQRGCEHDQVQQNVRRHDGRGVTEFIGAGERALLVEDHERYRCGQNCSGDVGADHKFAAFITVGDHASRKTEDQPRQPLEHSDEGNQQRVAGHR